MAHNGHRERLRAKFIKSPDLLEDHELIELLLFFSIPRVNTNNTAHSLFDDFENIKGIFDANITSLLSVDGVGERSALLIRVVSEITARYERTKFKPKMHISSHEQLANYLRSLFVGVENEIVYILSFDNNRNLLSTDKISEGSRCRSSIDIRDLTTKLLARNASTAILVHNHPDGNPCPSGDDIIASNLVKNALAPMQITLIEHFIIAGDTCTPIFNISKKNFYNKAD